MRRWPKQPNRSSSTFHWRRPLRTLRRSAPTCVSRLFREERTVTNAKFCQGFEVLLVSTSHCVFLSTFNAEATLSGRVWLDLYHKRAIHERRSMDPNESVRLQLFCHSRD